VSRIAHVATGVAALLLGVCTAPAHARTAKELNVCWVNKAPGGVQDLEIVADGPSYRTASLDAGDCLAWDVRPGQYKVTVEDVQEFRDALHQSCPKRTKREPRLTITIKRQHDLYKAYGPAVFANGGFTTNVRKDRRTTVTVILSCAKPAAP
jgi:hypothetical protein